MSLTLVLGGTRSGKSRYAERLAHATGLPVRYVATADTNDASMAERIAAHRARRDASWTTVEAGRRLAAAVGAPGHECVLVDGLGPWIAGVLVGDREGSSIPAEIDVGDREGSSIPAEIDVVIASAANREVIVVAEQAGEGMLPLDALSRAWLDSLGDATQQLAEAAQRVVLVVAGQPLEIKCA
jgi:adenosylcobinamide kinase / adenosylcobinamide-phosphate guanylyltransferase